MRRIRFAAMARISYREAMGSMRGLRAMRVIKDVAVFREALPLWWAGWLVCPTPGP